MKKTLVSTSLVALIHAMSALPALASGANLNSYMTNAQVVDYCSTAGIGSETKAQITLTDGTVVKGEVNCESEAVARASSGDPAALSTPGGHGGESDSEDNNASSSHVEDDSSDDNGDSSHDGGDSGDGENNGGGDNGDDHSGSSEHSGGDHGGDGGDD